MDLVQIFGSLISIAVLAYVASRLFPAKTALTNERVLLNVTRYCPDIDFAPSEAKVIVDKRKITALLLFPARHHGLAVATALGDRVVVRHFPDLNDISLERTSQGVKIDTGDFTQPSVKFDLKEEDADAVFAALGGTTTQGEPSHA